MPTMDAFETRGTIMNIRDDLLHSGEQEEGWMKILKKFMNDEIFFVNYLKIIVNVNRNFERLFTLFFRFICKIC